MHFSLHTEGTNRHTQSNKQNNMAPRRTNKHNKHDKKNMMDDLRSIFPDDKPPADWVIDCIRKFEYGVLNALLLVKGTDWINDKVSIQGKEHEDAEWHDSYSYLLLLACRYSVPVEGVRWLIKNGADLRAKDACGLNALHCAVIGQDPFIVEALLMTDAAEWMLQDENENGKLPAEFVNEVAVAWITHKDCMNKPNPQVKDKICKAQAVAEHEKRMWECAVKQEQHEAEERELEIDLTPKRNRPKTDINKFKSRVVATDRPTADDLAAAEEE